MARITDFEPITRDCARVHEPVQCGFFSFIGPQDKRYLVLETYGSDHRQMEGKVSQSFQLDEPAAARLITILRQEFPNLRL